jgi:CubicO group peptidase (beta-lactamase class C family)
LADALADFATNPDFVSLGFPLLNATEIPTCGILGQPSCSAEQAVRDILSQNPVAAAWQTPVYSNEAYQLLALAYENITGEGFPEAFKSGLVEALNLKRTSMAPPTNKSNTVLIDVNGVGVSEADLGGENP